MNENIVTVVLEADQRDAVAMQEFGGTVMIETRMFPAGSKVIIGTFGDETYALHKLDLNTTQAGSKNYTHFARKGCPLLDK